MKPERMIVGEKRILGFSIRWFHFVGNRMGTVIVFYYALFGCQEIGRKLK